MKLRYLLAITLAVATQSIGAYAAGVTFPGRSACLSQSKKWKIECQADKEYEGAYALMLEDTSTGIKKEIFQGDRWCEVLWSQDESSIAITDWLGSNCSDISIQRVKKSGQVGKLPDIIQSVPNIIPEEELIGHCYREALYWDSIGRLYFRIFGHTDMNPSYGFIYYFRLDPKSGDSILISKESGPNCNTEDKIYAERNK